MSFVDDWFDVVRAREVDRIRWRGAESASGRYVVLLFWCFLGWLCVAGLVGVMLLNR